MRTSPLVATFAVLATFTVDALAQRGGGRWRRPEEITNRVGLFFSDVAGPETDGDKVADLATLELVRAAVSAKQPSVLYLVNMNDDENTRQTFEHQLGQSDELGLELRCFHAGRIDLAKEATLTERYAKKAPLFVVFDDEGKEIEVSMAGYKASVTSLTKALEKAASGSVKPSLAAFAKKYDKVIRELEALLSKKQKAQGDLAKAAGDKGKIAKAEKEIKELEEEEAKLLEDEKELIEKARLPERAAGAKRIGDRPFGRGGRDGEEGGDGNGRGGRGGRNGG